RIELQRRLHFGVGLVVSLRVLEPADLRQARFGDARIDGERAVRGGEAVVDLAAEDVAQVRLRHGEQRPGARIIWIDLDRPAADAHHALLAADVPDIAGDPI